MGKVDRATKSYLTQSSVFADIFNFYLYEGQQVIDPGQLRELDPAELSMPYGTDRKGEPVQRYRDLFKALSAMEDQRAAYLLLGIESQDEVHYAAPVRNLLYDALQYARQVEETARNHREQKDYRGRRNPFHAAGLPDSPGFPGGAFPGGFWEVSYIPGRCAGVYQVFHGQR